MSNGLRNARLWVEAHHVEHKGFEGFGIGLFLEGEADDAVEIGLAGVRPAIGEGVLGEGQSSMNALDLLPELWRLIRSTLSMRDRHCLARSCKTLLAEDGGLAIRLPPAWMERLRWDAPYESICAPRRHLLWAMHGEGVASWACCPDLGPTYETWDTLTRIGLEQEVDHWKTTTRVGMQCFDWARIPREISFFTEWETEYRNFTYVPVRHLRTRLRLGLPTPTTHPFGYQECTEVDFPPREGERWVLDVAARWSVSNGASEH